MQYWNETLSFMGPEIWSLHSETKEAKTMDIFKQKVNPERQKNALVDYARLLELKILVVYIAATFLSGVCIEQTIF